MLSKVATKLRVLRRSERGAVFIYVTILLPVFVGFALLTIDGGRLFNEQTSLQNASDSFALAAAAELDGRPDAICRASRAIGWDEPGCAGADSMVANQSKFSDQGFADVTLAQVRFLESLPADDSQEITDAFLAVGNLDERSIDSRFVEVRVEPRRLLTMFPVSYLNAEAANEVTTGARAVAGFNTVACQFMPLFMCNPFEDPDDPSAAGQIFTAAEDSPEGRELRRRQIELRRLGPKADYFPGNFAFLMPEDDGKGGGAKALREALARVSPPTCFNLRGVTTEPGQTVGPVRQGLNVRFDIWDGPMSNPKQYRDNPAYRPARNVRKGYVPKDNGSPDYCDLQAVDPADWEDEEVAGLPRDDCFATDSCTISGDDEDDEDDEEKSGGRLGDGDWNCELYWTINFGGVNPPPGCYDGTGERPSRYEVYRYELDNGAVNAWSPGGEVGDPMCSNSQTSDAPDRRIIYGAIINCIEVGASRPDGKLNGKEEDVPVLTFAEFFITEPLREGGQGSIRVELRGLVEPGGENPALHDIVQLYR